MGQISDLKDMMNAIVCLAEAGQLTVEMLHVDGGADGQSAFSEREASHCVLFNNG